MQVKVFEAEDMRSALEKVKKALGPDALILSTRSAAKGRFGMRGKGGVEVTAAVDTDLDAAGTDHAPAKDFQAYLKNHEQQTASAKPEAKEDAALLEELRQMRHSFQDLAKEFSRAKDHRAANRLPGFPTDEKAEAGDSKGINDFCPDLFELGIGDQASRMISHVIVDSGDMEAAKDPERLGGFLESFISETLKMKNPLTGLGHGQKRLVFIGPTGVGKTTTIAKVAASCMLNYGKKIMLATIDNYRIAAVEQIKIYGQIMEVPVEVARSPEELGDIFSRHQDKDLILVDTAGRSPKDKIRQQELADFLDPCLQTENYLVLSAATGERDLHAAIDRFGHLNLHGLVMTKLDECDVLGQILNVGLEAARPLSFLTNGQKVPEDLLLPEPRVLAKMILNPDEVVEKCNIKEEETRPERFAS
ncbi:MAG: flagellar biosynthesis protein FlhF [Desulfobacteraceae bacterium]|nr:flagellar biosynthesis protein FlhF [Desulfobacteraceae bacterium]